jgi:hypothetical protein
MHPTNADVLVELNSKNQAFWCPSPSPPRRQPVPLTKLEYLILNHCSGVMPFAATWRGIFRGALTRLEQ